MQAMLEAACVLIAGCSGSILLPAAGVILARLSVPCALTGEKETRAWTIRAGMTAPQAAGVIHTCASS